MPDQWFRLPDTATSQGAYATSGPAYREQINGWSGNRIVEQPKWVVRYYAPTDVLTTIGGKPDSVVLTAADAASLFASSAADHLPEYDWSAEVVNSKFTVTE